MLFQLNWQKCHIRIFLKTKTDCLRKSRSVFFKTDASKVVAISAGKYAFIKFLISYLQLDSMFLYSLLSAIIIWYKSNDFNTFSRGNQIAKFYYKSLESFMEPLLTIGLISINILNNTYLWKVTKYIFILWSGTKIWLYIISNNFQQKYHWMNLCLQSLYPYWYSFPKNKSK